MNTAKVFKMGDPLLLQRAEEINEYNDSKLENIVELMLNTMTEKTGVGIAAPQIGISKRIIIFGFETNDRYPNEKSVPLTVLINPVMKVLDETEEDGWEGCLSVPGLRGLVSRYIKIEYSGYSFTEKKEITREAEGFHARVVQHEIDHLDGILYPRRIKDLTMFGYEDSLVF
tara:strand:+ start:1271 stop:1786 length:516 start_codon:yes stop_codon:yes gene_type:complete